MVAAATAAGEFGPLRALSFLLPDTFPSCFFLAAILACPATPLEFFPSFGGPGPNTATFFLEGLVEGGAGAPAERPMMASLTIHDASHKFGARAEGQAHHDERRGTGKGGTASSTG